MRIHELDISEVYADAILSGEKRFDVCYNDKGFQKGDLIRYTVKKGNGGVLSLNTVFQPFKDKLYEITYVLNPSGLKEGWVVFGIEPYIEVSQEQKINNRNIDSYIRDLLERFLNENEDEDEDDLKKEELYEEYAEYIDILFKNDCPGDIMKTSDFAESVKHGLFTDYDGIGYYVDENRHCSEIEVSFDVNVLKDMEKHYPWVMWYNR